MYKVIRVSPGSRKDCKESSCSYCPTVAVSALYTPDTQSLRGFMWQKDTRAVAVFVARCLRLMGVANT